MAVYLVDTRTGVAQPRTLANGTIEITPLFIRAMTRAKRAKRGKRGKILQFRPLGHQGSEQELP